MEDKTDRTGRRAHVPSTVQIACWIAQENSSRTRQTDNGVKFGREKQHVRRERIENGENGKKLK